MKYFILFNPSHNRVYFETSIKLSTAEFAITAKNLSVNCSDIQHQMILGIDYLTFETDGLLSEDDVRLIFDLSFIYALFASQTIDGELYLKPVEKLKTAFVDDSIGSMLKYTGKTNEIFTRMMLNIAALQVKERSNLRLLDPIAGKGTTLYEGLVKGYDVHGIEIGESVVNEAFHFIKRFLENARYKFTSSSNKLTDPKKTYTATKYTFETAASKEDFKNKNTKTIEFIAGNSMYANKYYKKNYFDIIVGDLPYGVQHGNVTNQKQSSLTRNPAELLDVCLPAWADVLKIGGAIVLAWNSNVLSRYKVEALAEKHGLTVKKGEEYLQFEHRVDQSIMRDIIVCVKEK